MKRIYQLGLVALLAACSTTPARPGLRENITTCRDKGGEWVYLEATQEWGCQG